MALATRDSSCCPAVPIVRMAPVCAVPVSRGAAPWEDEELVALQMGVGEQGGAWRPGLPGTFPRP